MFNFSGIAYIVQDQIPKILRLTKRPENPYASHQMLDAAPDNQIYPLDIDVIRGQILNTPIWVDHKPPEVGTITHFQIKNQKELHVRGVLSHEGKKNYDQGRQSLSIGYHVSGYAPDHTYYINEVSLCHEPRISGCAMKMEFSKDSKNIIKMLLNFNYLKIENMDQQPGTATAVVVDEKIEIKNSEDNEFEMLVENAMSAYTPEQQREIVKNNLKEKFTQVKNQVISDTRNLMEIFDLVKEPHPVNNSKLMPKLTQDPDFAPVKNLLFKLKKEVDLKNAEITTMKDLETKKKKRDAEDLTTMANKKQNTEIAMFNYIQKDVADKTKERTMEMKTIQNSSDATPVQAKNPQQAEMFQHFHQMKEYSAGKSDFQTLMTEMVKSYK
jgi:hypothetical protein